MTATLRDLTAKDSIDRHRREPRPKRNANQLPPVAILQVIDVDEDGEAWGIPAQWKGSGEPPRLRIETPRGRAPSPGNRVLARIHQSGDSHSGLVIKILESRITEIIGIFDLSHGQGRIRPVTRGARAEFRVLGTDSNGAQSGEVVLADVLTSNGYGLRRARVRERIGPLKDTKTFSRIAAKEHGIPEFFSEAALQEAVRTKIPKEGCRLDFRQVPFVTIDPDDARDFDDAIWAAPEGSGWRIRVAIADVAAFVPPGSALDREARDRGNSVYFPDRVIPMLPEALSAGICSLQEGEDRACLVAELSLAENGSVHSAKIVRGLIRSAHRFTYSEAQQIHDSGSKSYWKDILQPLWGAYGALVQARNARQPLEISTPEFMIRLGENGYIADVYRQPVLDANRLIESYMIAANVVAAHLLRNVQCMYRVHDQPDPEKAESLRAFLNPLGLRITKGTRLRPHHFNAILSKAAESNLSEPVNQAVLRAQAQAVYSPVNIGHFGLNLPHYVHFTSPIRRYADLMVHRALISCLELGKSGDTSKNIEDFSATAAHISITERRAIHAERDARARYLAAHFAEKIGARFSARISGVSRAGVFIILNNTGADALVPLRTFHDDYYRIDQTHHLIVGENSAQTYRLGDTVEVELLEANPASGGLIASITSGGKRDVRALSRRPRKRKRLN